MGIYQKQYAKINRGWRARAKIDELDHEIKPIDFSPENMTPNQLAEIKVSSEVQKRLGTQRPPKEELVKPSPPKEELVKPSPRATQDEFSKYFERIWGAGWKVGYYAKADDPLVCPFNDPDDRRIWNDGVLCGADAREVIEPRPVPKDIEQKAA